MAKAVLKLNPEDKPLARISVRSLVEFILRSGDIDTRTQRAMDVEAALAGARVHRKLQKSQKGRYKSEYSLSHDTEYDDLVIRVEGRADGVIGELRLSAETAAALSGSRDEGDAEAAAAPDDSRDEGDAEAAAAPGSLPRAGGAKTAAALSGSRGEGDAETAAAPDNAVREAAAAMQTAAPHSGAITLPAIDEIKGMYLDVGLLAEPFPVHLAQAKCYAAIYAHDNALPAIGVRMTYVNLESEDVRFFEFAYASDELWAWYEALVDAYSKWARWELSHRAARDASMESLEFPFPYREGQKQLTAAVYRTIRDKKDLFLMAPTGVGKTMSCVYPSVRALGQGLGDKIFYLTARNETMKAGREAFSILMERGLDFRAVLITSKEKICPLNEPSCNPDDCPYARGHFDRINDAVFSILETGRLIDRDVIRRVSDERMVCPFELTLDTATWCDAIVGDYNYVFDPNVQLKRFFGNGTKGDYIFLIDEAHNLVERGRDMYSAQIVKEHVLAAKRILEEGDKSLTAALSRVNKILLSMKHDCEDEPSVTAAGRIARVLAFGDVQNLIFAMMSLFEAMQNFYESSADGALKKNLLEFYFEVRDFVSAADYLSESYLVCSLFDEESHFAVKLFCVNPAERLTSCIERGRMAVLFSATLLPIDYYRRLLSTHEEALAVYARSPFEEKKRLLLVGRDVSTRYASRGDDMYRRIASYIAEVAGARVGNYMVFFPSYKMMRDVFRIYREEFDRDGVNWICQTPGMQEDDREIFLENFYENPAATLIGFCVMGGMFSEGIDLTGTKLIGAVVVGAGIPQVSCEREILKQYYDENGSGFDYAYRFPGMNKVEQAAGRVIRTAADLGVIVLLDERLMTGGYRRLFPREWADAGVCTAETVGEKVRAFWNAAGEFSI